MRRDESFPRSAVFLMVRAFSFQGNWIKYAKITSVSHFLQSKSLNKSGAYANTVGVHFFES